MSRLVRYFSQCSRGIVQYNIFFLCLLQYSTVVRTFLLLGCEERDQCYLVSLNVTPLLKSIFINRYKSLPRPPKNWRTLVGDKADRYRRRRLREFLVKWHEKSYWCCSWITEFWLERYQPRVCICVCVHACICACMCDVLCCLMVDPFYNTTYRFGVVLISITPDHQIFSHASVTTYYTLFYTQPLVEDHHMLPLSLFYLNGKC